MRLLLLLSSLLIFADALYTQAKLNLVFVASDPTFESAKQEYDSIWQNESAVIIEAMERISGMKFIDTLVTVNIVEMPSNSGGPLSPMRLRASYPSVIKKGTLIHELGHRLHFCLKNKTKEVNDHELLFLYLYDVWVELYGEEFAQQQILAENKRSNKKNDYKAMWEAALALGKEDRRAKLIENIQRWK